MSYSVYIIYSKLRNKYYTGYSMDVESRVTEHNMGATLSTRNGIPWVLVYLEKFENKSSAIKRENMIKRMKSRKYIERLIKSKSVD